jgi:hypothetical protein
VAVGAVVIGSRCRTRSGTYCGPGDPGRKPFRWALRAGSYEGIVSEVTWRATKLRTKTGNLVVLPNSFISKGGHCQFLEPPPDAARREVGVSYSSRRTR